MGAVRICVDYCDVFISCLDFGTHSLQGIHLWASDVIKKISKFGLMKKETNFVCISFPTQVIWSPSLTCTLNKVRETAFINHRVLWENSLFTRHRKCIPPLEVAYNVCLCSEHNWTAWLYLITLKVAGACCRTNCLLCAWAAVWPTLSAL